MTTATVTPDVERLCQQQRLDAAARSRHIRSYRSELKRRIAAGEVTVAAVLGERPPEISSWPILELVVAQAGWGYPAARKLLDKLGITENRSIGVLTLRQCTVISAVLEGTASPRRRCRECGCLDAAACTRTGQLTGGLVTCHWVRDDLCSACLDELMQEPAAGDPTDARWTHPSWAYTSALAAVELVEAIS